jgi:uncharacterized hydrophobic protein (TIGR00341 family)
LRRLEIIVPKDDEVKIRGIIEDFGVSYYQLDSGSDTVFILILPKTQVDGLLLEFKQIGVGRAIGKVIVSNVTFFLSGELLEQDSAKKKKIKRKAWGRVALDEITTSAKENGKMTVNYLALTAFAAVLAALGLLANNVVAIIGSMIIAPLMGPIVATSLSTVISEKEMFKDSIQAEMAGIGMCIVAGVVVARLFPEPFLTSEILGRSEPRTADVGLAIVSGLAAGICFVYGYATTLVGVAISASLAPPATNVGVLVGMSQYNYVQGSLGLLLINIFAINVACTLVFWASRIKPTTKRKEIAAKKLFRKRVLIAAIALTVTSTPIIYAAINAYNNIDIENKAIKIIEEEVDNLKDDGAKLLETKAAYDSADEKLTVEAHIIVTNEISDEFGDRIVQRIEKETGVETDLTLWIIVAETHDYETT